MRNHQDFVSCDGQVELKYICTRLNRVLEGWNGVLRQHSACASVSMNKNAIGCQCSETHGKQDRCYEPDEGCLTSFGQREILHFPAERRGAITTIHAGLTPLASAVTASSAYPA